MKLLETTAATIEFEIVENAGRDTDPRLVDAVRQNNTLRRALHEARNEIMALRAEVDKLSAPPSRCAPTTTRSESSPIRSARFS